MTLISAPGAADGLTGRQILPSASHQTVVILYVTLAFKKCTEGNRKGKQPLITEIKQVLTSWPF